jgi:hypothetical protein
MAIVNDRFFGDDTLTNERSQIKAKCFNFTAMKKLLLLLLMSLLLAACNRAVCPAYSDYANDMRNSFFQKGNHRADGINRVYRDTAQKKLR